MASRPQDYAVARIMLWDREVGAVAEDRTGSIVFEYAEPFRRSGLDISPLRLPLSLRGPVSFPELSRVASFAGLPGVLADSLPDAFGNAVIRRYFEERGVPDAALSPVQKLLYIGRRAMGALEFTPPLERAAGPAGEAAIEIAELVESARRVLEGDADIVLPEMMRVGASAGGARAKALVLWNPTARRIRSAFAEPHEGDEPWIVKFDGVTADAGGHETVREFAPGPFGRVEFAYSRMARAAGIEMTETHLLEERAYAHFMTRRFDRRAGERVHVHSLGGLHHADYNVRQVLSYEDWFRTIRYLQLGQPSLDQAYRRMVFNILARNQDDHVKNVEFLMTADGHWELAPAFDVTFAYGGFWTRTHQMTAGGRDDGFTRADLLAVGDRFDVPRRGAEIIDEVDAALELWKEEAAAAGLDGDWTRRIGGMFRRMA